jgi:hypothetical protein
MVGAPAPEQVRGSAFGLLAACKPPGTWPPDPSPRLASIRRFSGEIEALKPVLVTQPLPNRLAGHPSTGHRDDTVIVPLDRITRLITTVSEGGLEPPRPLVGH